MRHPPLVARARRLALELGVEESCRDETGALLHVLAAGGRVRRAGEIGTGPGVCTAWLAAALPPGVPLHTAELDHPRAAAAAALFADDRDVHVLHGDWRDVLPPEAPFDLLVVSCGGAQDAVDAVLGVVAPGGMIVLHDRSADRSRPDPRRDRWLAHPRVSAVTVATGRTDRAIVAAVNRGG